MDERGDDSGTRTQAGLRRRRLEEFNGISRRIFEENLLATDTSDDIVAEVSSRLAQPLNSSGEVVDFNRKSIPPARLGLGAIGHGLSASARGIRGAEDQTQIAA